MSAQSSGTNSQLFSGYEPALSPPACKLEPRILIINSDANATRRIRGLLAASGYSDIHVVTDAMFGLVRCRAIDPDVVILDPTSSFTRGNDILSDLVDLTSDSVFLPILVISSDNSNWLQREMLAHGACDFLNNPFDSCRLLWRVGQLVHMTALGRAARRGAFLPSAGSEQARLLEESWQQLRNAAQSREQQSHSHSFEDTPLPGRSPDCHASRVARVAGRLATELGLPAEYIRHVEEGAVVHDIGKVAIPDSILFKPRHLSADEFDIVKRHAIVGAGSLAAAPSLQSQVAQKIARSHHERWDGTGYPDRLCREEIALEARIVAVADCFDAMTSDRVYRRAITADHALSKVLEQSGRQFDPLIVEALLDIFSESPED